MVWVFVINNHLLLIKIKVSSLLFGFNFVNYFLYYLKYTILHEEALIVGRKILYIQIDTVR